MHKNIEELLKTLQVVPNSIDWYQLAFTHSSFNIDAKTTRQDYERLEFVGDSIINFVVAELSFLIHKEKTQGDLSKLRAAIVQSKALSTKAKEMNLDQYIRLGHSLPETTRESRRILEDVLEAFVGALYFDQGIEFVSEFIKKIFIHDIANFDWNNIHDYKSELQEEMQAEHRDMVHYNLVEERGPAHDRLFIVEVTYNEMILGRGQGKTKKEAEQMAALDALRKKAI